MIPSAEELNGHIGRTMTPPDLLTLVDERLREVFENVYAHPISLNTPKPWNTLELGYVMVHAENLFTTRHILGIIHPDRIRVNGTFYHIYATDPSFLDKITKINEYHKHSSIYEFIRRR